MKKRVLIALGLALVVLAASALQAAGAETIIWQIGDFDYSRYELAGSGLTGIDTFDFYVGTTLDEQFPSTLYLSTPSPYDYRGVHRVNIHFDLDGPYMDVNFVYGRGGDEVDYITLDGDFLAQIAGTENSWQGSPYTIPIGPLGSGSHVITIEVIGNTILDDAHVVDALKVTGHPLSVMWLPPLALDDWTLNENATLPIKFQLYRDNSLYCTPLQPTLEVTGYDPMYPRFDSEGCYYIANFRPNVPGNGLTATVYINDVEVGVSREFDIVEAGTPNGRGRSK
jgi:hypothetical protein